MGRKCLKAGTAAFLTPSTAKHLRKKPGIDDRILEQMLAKHYYRCIKTCLPKISPDRCLAETPAV
jgi:hypothetical protein